MTKPRKSSGGSWKFSGFPKPEPTPADGNEPRPEEWSQALRALRAGDTRLIGSLLSKGYVVPFEVTTILGMMLNPAPGYRDTVLMATVPKRWTSNKVMERTLAKAAARREIWEVYKEHGKLEAALQEVAAARKKRGQHASRAYLMNCWDPDIGPEGWELLRIEMLLAMSSMKPNRS
jgi:hypothetical protein